MTVLKLCKIAHIIMNVLGVLGLSIGFIGLLGYCTAPEFYKKKTAPFSSIGHPIITIILDYWYDH